MDVRNQLMSQLNIEKRDYTNHIETDGQYKYNQVETNNNQVMLMNKTFNTGTIQFVRTNKLHHDVLKRFRLCHESMRKLDRKSKGLHSMEIAREKTKKK